MAQTFDNNEALSSVRAKLNSNAGEIDDNTANKQDILAEGPFVDGDKTKLDNSAEDSEVVHLTGDETIAGTKTFTSSPIVPTPTAGTEVATKQYVDDNVGGAVSSVNGETGAVVLTTGDITEDTDKNYITDAEKNKLTNIETGAEVNTVDSVNGRTGVVTGLAEDNEVVKLTGNQTVAGNKTFTGILKRNEAKYSITATSGTIDLNYNNGNFQEVSLSGTTTFTISNENIGILILEINDGDAYSITWDSSITWADGETAPTLTSRSIVSLWRSSTGDLLGDWQNFTA